MSENLDPQTGRAADLPGVIRARIRQAVSARPLAATAWVVAGVGLGILLTTLVLLTFPDPERNGLTAEDFADKTLPASVKLVVEKRTRRPNVVFILADDLGYGDIKAYGPTPINTPNLDQLAQEGVRYTSFYAAASLCSPSRAGLLTGRYALRTGISYPFQNEEVKGLGGWVESRFVSLLAYLGTADLKSGGNLVNGLPPSELTIAEGLKQAGYRTGIVGKWHLGDFKRWPKYHPHKNGFDWFVGFNASNDDWPVAFYDNDQEIIADIGFEQEAYTQIFTQEAVEFIERNQEQPFFLFFSHKDPHQPFFPSSGFAGKSKGGSYGDAVEELDGSVGTILETLERLDLAENTVVIFTSDNGPWYEGNPGGLRGRKGMSYEGGYKVPFLMRYPGRVEPATVNDAPAMGIDLLPSIFAMAGVRLPDDRVIDGISLVDETGAPLASDVDRGPIYFFSGYDFEAVRQGRYKLIERNSTYGWPIPLDKPVGFAAVTMPRYSPEGDERSIPKLNSWPKLYDVNLDPSEAYNLSELYPDEVTRLEEQLETWRTEFYRDPRGRQ